MLTQRKINRSIILLILLLHSALAFASQGRHYSITSIDGGRNISEHIPDSIKDAGLDPFTGDLTEIRKRRLLRVLVTHSRTDFFLEEGRIRGAQAELIHELIKHLNKGITRESDKLFVQFIPVEFHQLIPALVAGEGDIAAAFLTVTAQREKLVDFVTGQRLKTDEVIVANSKAPDIDTLGQLSGKSIYVLKNSSYAEHLVTLNQQFALVGVSGVVIEEADERLLTEDILELVNAGIIEYTVCDDFKANLWARVLPNLRVLNDVKISSNKLVGWAIRKNSGELREALDSFTSTVRKGTLLGNVLFSRYFKNTQWIENPIEQAERDKLAQVIGLFEKYGALYQFDPLALAAQAYQESRLDNTVKSHRGAVGIMQLLPTTARDPNVAIENVEQLENNIHAGAKYLRFLQERYFSDEGISPWDQRLLAWAAYNAGPANITRLRNAARKAGLDPNIWFGNVEVMAARMISREPVRYVANIHKYYTAYRLIQERSVRRQQALEAQIKAL